MTDPDSLPAKKTPLTFVKNAALFFAAPVVALGYAAAMPFVSSVMLFRMWKEHRNKRSSA
jgi:hypothetical protein